MCGPIRTASPHGKCSLLDSVVNDIEKGDGITFQQQWKVIYFIVYVCFMYIVIRSRAVFINMKDYYNFTLGTSGDNAMTWCLTTWFSVTDRINFFCVFVNKTWINIYSLHFWTILSYFVDGLSPHIDHIVSHIYPCVSSLTVHDFEKLTRTITLYVCMFYINLPPVCYCLFVWTMHHLFDYIVYKSQLKKIAFKNFKMHIL